MCRTGGIVPNDDMSAATRSDTVDGRRTSGMISTAADCCLTLVRGPLTVVLGWLFVRFARPLVLEKRGRPWLVVAPHPDDETLGCGATIARARGMGITVHVAVVTDGRGHPPGFPDPQSLVAIRRKETLRACGILGVPASCVEFLGFVDGRAGSHIEAIRARLIAIIAEIDPDLIFVPSGIDNHADHRAVAAAVDGGLRDGALGATVLAYPLWFWFPRFLLRAFATGACFRLVGVAAGPFLAVKAKALTEFHSQVGADAPRDALLDGLFARQRRAGREYFFEVTRPRAGGAA